MPKKNILKMNKTLSKNRKKKIEIKKDMTFGEAISLNQKTAKVLAENGMFCGCCPMAMMETIEQGANAHGVDVKKLLKKINK
jgi:hybrid cluster-associated redox disulfide protein